VDRKRRTQAEARDQLRAFKLKRFVIISLRSVLHRYLLPTTLLGLNNEAFADREIEEMERRSLKAPPQSWIPFLRPPTYTGHSNAIQQYTAVGGHCFSMPDNYYANHGCYHHCCHPDYQHSQSAATCMHSQTSMQHPPRHVYCHHPPTPASRCHLHHSCHPDLNVQFEPASIIEPVRKLSRYALLLYY
jgi:hypothetical protein